MGERLVHVHVYIQAIQEHRRILVRHQVTAKSIQAKLIYKWYNKLALKKWMFSCGNCHVLVIWTIRVIIIIWKLKCYVEEIVQILHSFIIQWIPVNCIAHPTGRIWEVRNLNGLCTTESGWWTEHDHIGYLTSANNRIWDNLLFKYLTFLGGNK